MIYWIIAAVAIVATLAAVAGYYVWQVYQLQRRNRARWDELAAETAQQRQRINNSIQILAAAIGKDELTLTEASIRIAFLMDSLEVSESVREEFSAFYQLREATSHIPYLDAWKQLSRKEQAKFDLQRMQHEATYGDFVLDAAKRIRGRAF